VIGSPIRRKGAKRNARDRVARAQVMAELTTERPTMIRAALLAGTPARGCGN